MADEKQHKEGSGGSGNATLKPKKRTKKKTSPRKSPTKPLPPWKVLLHNDDVNDMLYVMESIVTLTPLNPEQAYERMIEAHKRGLSLLLTTHKERAELYQEQFQSKGLTVTIEPAE